MAEMYDVEITVAGDGSKLIGVVKSLEDAVDKARIAALVPVDRRDAEITIKLRPRPA
jgi:hypothetical protein